MGYILLPELSPGLYSVCTCLSYRLQILHGSSYGLSNQMTKYKSTKVQKVQKYKNTKVQKNKVQNKKYKNTKTQKNAKNTKKYKKSKNVKIVKSVKSTKSTKVQK